MSPCAECPSAAKQHDGSTRSCLTKAGSRHLSGLARRAWTLSEPFTSSIAHIAFFFLVFIFLARLGVLDVTSAVELYNIEPSPLPHAIVASCDCKTASDVILQESTSSGPGSRSLLESPEVRSDVVLSTAAIALVAVGGEAASAPGVTDVQAAEAAGEIARQLSGDSDCGGHATDALLFLFSAIIIGTVILHLTTLPGLHHLQQTVALFVLGIIYSLVQKGLNLQDHLGQFGHAYEMWMDIDPHLILFAFLPPLLAEDAMQIDTQVARRVAKQCIFLAGPGVLLNAFMTAGFLYFYLPYNWSFLLCLTLGSILAATDPVAVVGLLKELGASPTLTIQIQGESLLNDGTSIVMYMLAYDMLKGKEYGAADITEFMVVTALCAAGLGWFMGNIFCLWIRKASKRLEGKSSTIQVSLTLCCAYWTFIFAEGVLHISGVLCTVSASLVLADRIWPSIVEKETMIHIWHMFGYLGNTIIFFVAGALTGHVMVDIEAMDWLHLLVLYAALMFIRGCVFFSSRPVLKYLSVNSKAVSRADALIMTWGGLRGAVGLALAIQVKVDRAGGQLDAVQANRVLFFTGGIATLTLMVNATTCPALVRFLGITQSSEGKMRMLMRLSNQLALKAEQGTPNKAVTRVLREMLEEVMTGIFEKYHRTRDFGVRFEVQSLAEQQLIEDDEPQQMCKEHVPLINDHSASNYLSGALRMSAVSRLSASSKRAVGSVRASVKSFLVQSPEAQMEGLELVQDHQQAKMEYYAIPQHQKDILSEIVDMPMVEREDAMRMMAETNTPDPQLTHAVNQAFLALVQSEYWHKIEAGEFIEGSNHAEKLLASISYAIPEAASGLTDFDYLMEVLDMEDRLADMPGFANRLALKRGAGTDSSTQIETYVTAVMEDTQRKNSLQGKLLRIVTSMSFGAATVTVIFMNMLALLIEDRVRDDANRNNPVWLVMESSFAFIFFMEFLLKFTALRSTYFASGWNLFDFVLVLTSFVGLGFEVKVMFLSDDVGSAQTAEAKELSEEARMLRLNRMFRVLRIVRAVRVVRLVALIRKALQSQEYSVELGEQLRAITILTSFARAHLNSQIKFTEFFGRQNQFQTCEEARCILKSMTCVYKAISIAAHEAQKLDEATMVGINILREAYRTAEDLTKFVVSAHETGVVNAKEAEAILDPLRDHRRIWNAQIRDQHMGQVVDLNKSQSFKHLNSMSSTRTASDGSKAGDALQEDTSLAMTPIEDVKDAKLGAQPGATGQDSVFSSARRISPMINTDERPPIPGMAT